MADEEQNNGGPASWINEVRAKSANYQGLKNHRPSGQYKNRINSDNAVQLSNNIAGDGNVFSLSYQGKKWEFPIDEKGVLNVDVPAEIPYVDLEYALKQANVKELNLKTNNPGGTDINLGSGQVDLRVSIEGNGRTDRVILESQDFDSKDFPVHLGQNTIQSGSMSVTLKGVEAIGIDDYHRSHNPKEILNFDLHDDIAEQVAHYKGIVKNEMGVTLDTDIQQSSTAPSAPSQSQSQQPSTGRS